MINIYNHTDLSKVWKLFNIFKLSILEKNVSNKVVGFKTFYPYSTERLQKHYRFY